MDVRKETICSRDGNHSAAALIVSTLRPKNYAINSALQAKMCCLLVGFDYISVAFVDLLD